MISLKDQIRSVTDRAVQRGALISIPTETTIIEDRGIPFIVHITTLQERKRQAESRKVDDDLNPFLPPDPELFIGDVSPGHISVLNKFNVLDLHLLIVTRRFEPQEMPLNREDFEALAECMHQMDGLGFYNGGTVAGASQGHKHLQLVPLPMGTALHPTPLDEILPTSSQIGIPATVPDLPFTHSWTPLDGNRLDRRRGAELEQLYRRACTAVGVHDITQPYNLLLTRHWMLVVPRSREHWHGISINALGFAGSILVRNHHELEQVRETGPLEVLRSVVGDQQRDEDSR